MGDQVYAPYLLQSGKADRASIRGKPDAKLAYPGSIHQPAGAEADRAPRAASALLRRRSALQDDPVGFQFVFVLLDRPRIGVRYRGRAVLPPHDAVCSRRYPGCTVRWNRIDCHNLALDAQVVADGNFLCRFQRENDARCPRCNRVGQCSEQRQDLKLDEVAEHVCGGARLRNVDDRFVGRGSDPFDREHRRRARVPDPPDIASGSADIAAIQPRAAAGGRCLQGAAGSGHRPERNGRDPLPLEVPLASDG